MESVRWKTTIDGWYNNPQQALAWIMKCFFDAKINPDSPTSWIASDGVIMIGDFKAIQRRMIEKSYIDKEKH